VSDEVTGLQAEFPAFRIWREDFPGRRRYVARSRHQSLHPHTVVTADLGELRDALQSRPAPDTASSTPRPLSRLPANSLAENERDATLGSSTTRRVPS
jgi:hypothetical protein